MTFWIKVERKNEHFGIKPLHFILDITPNMTSELSVARWADPFPELSAKILVNRKETLGSVLVRRTAHQDIFSGMELSIPNILGSITVFQGVVKKSSISVRRSRETDLIVEGHILHRQNMPADMNIHNPDFYGRLQIVFSRQPMSDLSIRRRAHSGLPSAITIPQNASLGSSIAIWPKKDVSSSLTVLSGNLWGSISIPYHQRMDMQSRITVRVKLISDLEIPVGVRSGNLGSNIKVRVDGHTDQPSHLRTRRRHLDNILSGNSEVTIRRDAAYEQYSHVTIRHSDQTELPSDLGIREHSHITGYLTVRRTAQRSLQSDMSV